MSEQSTVTRTEISAPLTGIMVPIDQVPDPVFAGRWWVTGSPSIP